jgi:uncharacterized protein YjbJ (UPF0337 family)
MGRSPGAGRAHHLRKSRRSTPVMTSEIKIDPATPSRLLKKKNIRGAARRGVGRDSLARSVPGSRAAKTVVACTRVAARRCDRIVSAEGVMPRRSPDRPTGSEGRHTVTFRRPRRGGAEHVSEHDKDTAGEARKGLAASVAGKAKEVAGAVIGNDSLAREGQLQQAEAEDRRQANAEEAIADAEAARAAQKLRAANERAHEENQQAAREEAAQIRSAEQAADAEQSRAEAEARAHADAGKVVAERQAADEVRNASADALVAQAEAADQERNGERERQQLAAEATLAEVRAEQAQQEAKRLEDQLDRS